MNLPNDVSRCHDNGCFVREYCERWIQRNTGCVHTESLREGRYCTHRILSATITGSNDTARKEIE